MTVVKYRLTFIRLKVRRYRLIVSKLNLRIQHLRRPQGKNVPKRLAVSKLKQDSKRQTFISEICSRSDSLEHSLEDVDES